MRKTIALLFLLASLLTFTVAIYAAAPAPSASTALPPRPTLTPTRIPTTPPTSTPTSPSMTVPARPRLAFIQLDAPDFPSAWSTVEWQGGDGVWHVVEGWQSRIENGQTRWVVESKDYGPHAGLFRWIISTEQDGPTLAISQPFDLPSSDGETVIVLVP